jgi:Ca-activated chloride channel homolog
MVAISFLYPKFLFLLLLIPFFVFVYFFSIVYNKKKAVVFSNFEAMERFYDVEFFSKNFLALYLNLAILILLIFTISGTAVSFSVDTSAFSYIVAIDNSGSMTTSDISPTRLDAAKVSAKNFIESLPIGVDIGVISFSGDAEVLQEMDNSKIKAKMAVDNMRIGQIQGTNIYNALITANKLFEDQNMKSIVLISDGQLNVGDAPQITRYANRNNLIVNTIAVGTEKGGLTDLNTLSTVDENFLKALALNSGGKFFRARDVNELENSFSALIRETNEQVTIDLSLYSLFAVVILFVLTWILHNLRFKVIP